MTARDRLGAVFVAAAGGVGTADREVLRREAVEAGLGIAAGMVGCSITELDGPDFRTGVSAGEFARLLDQRQYEVGIGPCVAATRGGRRQIVEDVAAFARSNPRFAEACTDRGVQCVLSVPLTGLPASRSMNFYGAASASLSDPVTLARAGLLSRAIAAVDGDLGPARIAETSGSRTGAAHRDLIERAQVTVMRRQHISAQEAFYWLVRRSRREQRSIFATAQAVLRHAGSDDS